jgi:hypothetical protein
LAILRTDVSVRKREILIGAILLFYFLTFISVLNYLPKFLVSFSSNIQFLQAAQYFVIALTLVVSSHFFSRLDSARTVGASFAAISILGVLLAAISSEVVRLAIIFAMVVIFCSVVLVLFTWFWRMTRPQERGRITGFMGFIALPFYFVTARVLIGSLEFVYTALMGSLLTLLALVVFLSAHPKMLTRQERPKIYFEKRTVLLYSVPWILFSLVNATLAADVSANVFVQVSSSFYLFLVALQVAGVVFGALVGGVIADVFGRRVTLGLGITLYGIGSALLGLLQNNTVFSVAYAINGLSWGILFMLYVFVVWGDLATERHVAKMYSIGLAAYYLALGVGILAPRVSQAPLVVTALTSCLVIFCLNIPVILAPELLPSDFRERIKLKLYLRTVRKASKKPAES